MNRDRCECAGAVREFLRGSVIFEFARKFQKVNVRIWLKFPLRIGKDCLAIHERFIDTGDKALEVCRRGTLCVVGQKREEDSGIKCSDELLP